MAGPSITRPDIRWRSLLHEVIFEAETPAGKAFDLALIWAILLSVMYVIEGEENGFTDIPTSVYWAIVTLTTVGYGDVSPHTPLGQALASLVMILGYGIIAAPTGIVTVEISEATRKNVSAHACPACSVEGHDADAVHCKYCGARL